MLHRSAKSIGWMFKSVDWSYKCISHCQYQPVSSGHYEPPDVRYICPKDISQHRPQVETHTCYNCNKPGHISPNCPKPQKQCVQNTGAELDVQDLVAKAVTAALDARDKAKEEVKGGF